MIFYIVGNFDDRVFRNKFIIIVLVKMRGNYYVNFFFEV